MSSSTDNEEEKKKAMRMNIIYKALEDGWSVRKSGNDSRTFEFTKSQSLASEFKGLIVFGKTNTLNGQNICDDIQRHLQRHLENIKKEEGNREEKDHKDGKKKPEGKRSVSTPIIKKD